ncbi:diphosphoinositol pentakisphosphate kinase [Holotrichia oblita]|uniref:Diphosphoinositol pentakisphosphate kinase n=1 Tax=Holotrichia oblita TaxID=644536 RepID=A0ACB9TM99_HOLOL|nr:diphosphoinositol pentakisphosphate kinase [Holotrichia oblita]
MFKRMATSSTNMSTIDRAQHKIFIIQCYYRTGRKLENGEWVYSINRCIEEFRQQFPNLPVTYAQLLKQIQACVIKFGEIGAVTRKPGGGAPKKRTANLIEDVQQRMEHSPKKSVATLSQQGDLELCDSSDTSLGPPDMEDGGKQVVVGVCAMAKKSQSKPMKEILTRLQEFEYIKIIVFPEEVILQKPVDEWPGCDCLISFHSKGFPLEKAVQYAQLHKPYVINNLHMQYDIQDRRKVYSILESEGIEIPRYAVLDRDSSDPKHHELVESEDHVEVNGVVFNKPFVEKPVSAEDHNIYIYYPTSAGGGSQRLFRKIGSRSSVYSPESRVRKTGSYIYEDFMPTDGTDVKVYTVGPDYAHAEARKSPALDGKVERDREGKEIRYPVILNNAEKLISRKVCLAFKQAVCGFDLLRANGKSFVCDVNGFSFVKNSNKYYDDCAKILGNMILRELAPTLHIPWSVPFQLDDPPIVPTTFGKMMELRCVVAVIRHGDRTPKQKMKVEVRHPKFFEIFEKYDGYKQGHVKLKRPKQLQEILDIARSLLAEIQQHEADPEIEEKQGKLEQLKSVLEMYGHFSGINRKVQMKYQPKGRPRGSSSDDVDKPAEPSLVLILKWGGELTPAGRIQAEELGRIFRCMYPGGQGRHLAGSYFAFLFINILVLFSLYLPVICDFLSFCNLFYANVSYSDMYAWEISERDKRKCNIILFGCQENCDSSKEQIDSDTSLLKDMTSTIKLDMLDTKPIRVGKFDGTKSNRARPLRVILGSEAAVFVALKTFKEAKLSGKYSNISMYRDRTPMQIQLHRNAKMELDTRLRNGEYAGAQGLGLLRLHSTFRHDLKIYASDEGRVQMTAAAFAKGLLALEGELTPILVQMVKSANTNGLLDNDCDSSKYQNMCKSRLHELMQLDREFTADDKEKINPGNSVSIADALDFVKNPVKCCKYVHDLIKSLMEIVKQKKEDLKTKDAILYHGETWELMGRRWGKIEKDFYTKNKNYDISKIPDIYDCIKYDLQHNQHTLQFEQAEELYINAKYLADIVIPQEYGLTVQEKLTIGQESEENVNRLNPRYSHGVSSPGRHVRTRLYFTSESHIHSLITVLRHGELVDNPLSDHQSDQSETELSVTPTNAPTSPPVFVPRKNSDLDMSNIKSFRYTQLSPISGSFDFDSHSELDSPIAPSFKLRSHNSFDDDDFKSTENATNELPLTELNLKLFTSKQDMGDPVRMNTNELPLSDINFKHLDVELWDDNTSLEVNWESENSDADFSGKEPNLMRQSKTSKTKQTKWPQHRSYSDPNILESEKLREKITILENINRALLNNEEHGGDKAKRSTRHLSVVEVPAIPFSFYTPEGISEHQDFWNDKLYAYTYARHPSNLLSFFSSPPSRLSATRSFSHPTPVITDPSMSDSDNGCASARRHRHSIAGQMSYFKMLGFGFGGPIAFKKSANSLFSTAVISGSSSAPNLRDMIPSTTSASGKYVL